MYITYNKNLIKKLIADESVNPLEIKKVFSILERKAERSDEHPQNPKNKSDTKLLNQLNSFNSIVINEWKDKSNPSNNTINSSGAAGDAGMMSTTSVNILNTKGLDRSHSMNLNSKSAKSDMNINIFSSGSNTNRKYNAEDQMEEDDRLLSANRSNNAQRKKLLSSFLSDIKERNDDDCEPSYYKNLCRSRDSDGITINRLNSRLSESNSYNNNKNQTSESLNRLNSLMQFSFDKNMELGSQNRSSQNRNPGKIQVNTMNYSLNQAGSGSCIQNTAIGNSINANNHINNNNNNIIGANLNNENIDSTNNSNYSNNNTLITNSIANPNFFSGSNIIINNHNLNINLNTSSINNNNNNNINISDIDNNNISNIGINFVSQPITGSGNASNTNKLVKQSNTFGNEIHTQQQQQQPQQQIQRQQLQSQQKNQQDSLNTIQEMQDLAGLVKKRFYLAKLDDEIFYNPWDCPVIRESELQEIYKNFHLRHKLVKYCKNSFMKVQQNKTSKISTINFDLVKAWICGIQLAAINIQSLEDDFVLINKVFFRFNNGCGYVLKPKFLRNPKGAYDRYYLKPLMKLEIDVISCLMLQTCVKNFNKSENIFFESFLVGCWEDDKMNPKHKSKSYENNLINLVFDNESIKFDVYETELCFWMIKIYLSNTAIARSCVPISIMNEGIRVVPLFDLNCNEFPDCVLLARIKKKNFAE